MNQQEAKEILTLYRPGTSDADDPSFAEALQLCRQDPELQSWFEQHCAVYLGLRGKLKAQPPHGFKEQILAERKVHTAPWARRPVVLAAIAAALALAAVLWSTLQTDSSPGYSEYRTYMMSRGLRSYGMDLETNDLSQIRSYLASRNANADFTLPAGLEKNATSTGCVVLNWSGKPVSMICFNSGNTLRRGRGSDVFLFVTDNSALPNAPAGTAPSVETVNRTMTATWRKGNQTYLLVAEGNEEFLRRFL